MLETCLVWNIPVEYLHNECGTCSLVLGLFRGSYGGWADVGNVDDVLNG